MSSSSENSPAATTDPQFADAAGIKLDPAAHTVDDLHDQPTSAVTSFVRDHPVLVLTGGVVAGLIVGSLIPRRTGKALVKRTSALSEVISAAAVSFGQDAAKQAGAAGTQIRKGSHVLADHAEDWTAVALRSASAFAQSAAENIGKLSETAAEKAEELGDVAADRIDQAARKTSRRIDKALPVAEAAATHAGRRLGDAIADFRARLKR